MSQTPTPEVAASKAARAAVILGVLALAVAALAIYQWLELVAVRHGASALCSLNSTVNCETVWNSAFASRVHRWLGVPVAGLGLIWGLVAVALCIRLWAWAKKGTSLEAEADALRLMAVGGVAACVVFAVASVGAGALCLTCLGTYVLTVAFAVCAFQMLPRSAGNGIGAYRVALLWAIGLTVLFYVPVLVLGLQTPRATDAVPHFAPPPAEAPSTTSASAAGPTLQAFLASLGPTQKQALSDALAAYRSAAVPTPPPSYVPRRIQGDPAAPVHLVEFTDVLCSHCKHLADTLHELRQALPPGLLSIESRHFPLDSDCNPLLTQSNHTGVRCAAARAEICLEDAPEYTSIQEHLFAEQQSLTQERVLEIAAGASVPREKLMACMASPETEQKLQDDVHYAQLYRIEGTPLVLINGRMAGPMPAFLYAMVLARGDANAPELAALPPAAPQTPAAP